MRPVSEPGQVGELYVGGPNIALGYYADPARTEGAFMPNPIPGALPETVYRTGDLVRIGESGELFFSGRADNQIKHQATASSWKRSTPPSSDVPVSSAAAAPITSASNASMRSSRVRPKSTSSAAP